MGKNICKPCKIKYQKYIRNSYNSVANRPIKKWGRGWRTWADMAGW
jgi:hypothetical protein